MIKVAMVGLGGMGSTHYNLYRQMEDVELVALVDVEESRVREKAAACGARAYTDFSEMLEKESPDYVDIATPSYTHAQLAIEAMERGVSVLSEKPAALQPEDIMEIYRCAEKNQVFFMAAHVLRFWPEYQWLRAAVQEKKYGELLHLNLWRTGEKPRTSWHNWMLDPEKSGMVPYDLHIHDVDFMIFLLGRPESCSAFEIRQGQTNNYIRANYRYSHGLEVCAEAAWYSGKAPFSMGYEAILEGGVAIFRDGRLLWYPNDQEPQEISQEQCVPQGLSEINVGDTQGYYNEIRYFIRYVEENRFPEAVKEQELLDTLWLIDWECRQGKKNNQ